MQVLPQCAPAPCAACWRSGRQVRHAMHRRTGPGGAQSDEDVTRVVQRSKRVVRSAPALVQASRARRYEPSESSTMTHRRPGENYRPLTSVMSPWCDGPEGGPHPIHSHASNLCTQSYEAGGPAETTVGSIFPHMMSAVNHAHDVCQNCRKLRTVGTSATRPVSTARGSTFGAAQWAPQCNAGEGCLLARDREPPLGAALCQ
jgi:hypothetical protein